MFDLLKMPRARLCAASSNVVVAVLPWIIIDWTIKKEKRHRRKRSNVECLLISIEARVDGEK